MNVNGKSQTGPLPGTNQIAQEPQPLRSAVCPICQIDRPVFYDLKRQSYFTRHQQIGHSNYCDMSNRPVTEKGA